MNFFYDPCILETLNPGLGLRVPEQCPKHPGCLHSQGQVRRGGGGEGTVASLRVTTPSLGIWGFARLAWQKSHAFQQTVLPTPDISRMYATSPSGPSSPLLLPLLPSSQSLLI